MMSAQNIKKLCAGIAAVVLVGAGAVQYCKIAGETARTAGARETSTLCKLCGFSGRISRGYDFGTCYAITGEKITQVSGERQIPVTGFNLLGSSTSAGMLYDWADVLCTADTKQRTGADIQTTIHYNAQQTAAGELARYFPQESGICSYAAVTIVLRDGTVLVSAGNNLCSDVSAYFSDDPAILNNALENKAALPVRVGSVAKPLMARVMLLHGDEVSPEWSLRNSFEDVSWYSPAPNIAIHNWDWQKPENYTSVREDGAYVRFVSFLDSLRESSNTYYLRHMLAYGNNNPTAAYELFSRTFGSNVPMQTDGCYFPAVECPADRLYWWFFGQDFELSPIRLASMWNMAISGEAYLPFFVANVKLDGEQVYTAEPKPRGDIGFPVEANDLLTTTLADNFSAYNIDKSITAPFEKQIANRQFLSKSGTADVIEPEKIVNACRVLSYLDENHELVATAVILVSSIHSDDIDGNVLYKILFDTMSAAGITGQNG